MNSIRRTGSIDYDDEIRLWRFIGDDDGKAIYCGKLYPLEQFVRDMQEDLTFFNGNYVRGDLILSPLCLACCEADRPIKVAA